MKLEFYRRDVGVQTWTEVWSSGALEARCRRVDVEAWRHRPLKLWRRAVGVAT